MYGGVARMFRPAMSALQPQQPQQTHSAQQRPRDDTAARRQVMATGQMTKGDASSGHEPRNAASHHVPGVYYEDLLDPLCHRVSQALDGMKSALSGAAPPAMAGMYSYEDFMHLYRSTRENILMALDDFLVGISLRHRIPPEHAAAEQGAGAGLYPGSPMSSREVPQLPLEHCMLSMTAYSDLSKLLATYWRNSFLVDVQKPVYY